MPAVFGAVDHINIANAGNRHCQRRLACVAADAPAFPARSVPLDHATLAAPFGGPSRAMPVFARIVDGIIMGVSLILRSHLLRLGMPELLEYRPEQIPSS